MVRFKSKTVSRNNLNFSETLRKYPPLTLLARVAKEDYDIPNTEISLKKGTIVMISNYGIHHDPEIYPEPEKFNPDRFSKQAIENRHSFAFVPFGEGPRVCIGIRLVFLRKHSLVAHNCYLELLLRLSLFIIRFAIVEIKTALAKLLTTYKFELDRSRTSVPLKISTKRIAFMTPSEGIFVNFTKNENLI